MKKTLQQIFKGFTVFDYVYMLIAVMLVIGVNIYSKFPVLPSVFACLMIVGVVFLSKGTYHGYAFGFVLLGFYLYYAVIYSLYSEVIISALLFLPGLVFHICNKAKNKEYVVEKFDKWDYITYIVVLALLTYPTYLLLVQLEANYALMGAFSILVAFSILYLGMKHIKFRKYLYVLITALEFAMFVLMVFQLDFTALAIAVGFLCVLVYTAVKHFALLAKYNKQKKQKTVVLEENKTKSENV